MTFFIVLLIVTLSQQQLQGESIQTLDQCENGTQPDYNFKRPLNIHRLDKDEKREIYHYEQTFVIRDSGLDDKVRRCELIEIYKENEAEKVANILSNLFKRTVQHVDMKKIMHLSDDCDSIDSLHGSDNVKNDVFTIDWNIPSYSFTNGIYPGTKWCGFGDAARGYHDLAENRKIDRCCRTHDFCPIKVLRYDRRYNLTNTAIHSKSHCLCDEAFYKCLKEENSWTANFLIHFYFYAASPECISGFPEIPQVKMKFVPATKTWFT